VPFLDDAGSFLGGPMTFPLMNKPAAAFRGRGLLSVFLCGPTTAGGRLLRDLPSLRTTAVTLLRCPRARQEVPRKAQGKNEHWHQTLRFHGGSPEFPVCSASVGQRR
jgi:hypothetical protein